MPLGRFAMLNELVNELKSEDSRTIAKFAKFKVYVIVLHDPDDDKFIKKVSDKFRMLDSMTGERMLFLTWIQPPAEINRILGEIYAYYFNRYHIAFDKNENDGSIRELMEAKRRFNVGEHESALVLCTDLLSSNRLIVQTSAHNIQDQLLLIGDFCNNIPDGAISEGETFAKLEAIMKQQRAESEEEMTEITSDILCDVFSFQAKKEGLDCFEHDRQHRMNKILEKAEEKMNKRRNANEDASDEIIAYYDLLLQSKREEFEKDPRHELELSRRYISTEYYDKALSDGPCMSFLTNDKNTIRNYNKSLPKGAEKYSVTLCNSFNILYSIYRWGPFKGIDLSGLVIYLTKAIENECYSSIFQYCRYLNGIQMPDYYKCFCDRLGTDLSLEITGRYGQPLFCKLNRYKTKNGIRELEACTLGAVNIMRNWLYDYAEHHNWNFGEEQNWIDFEVLRNRAAHSFEIGIEDVNETSSLFDAIIDSSFDQMNLMKTYCKNER